MYPNGGVVTLAHAKTHGEGEDAVSLSAGVCGMVVNREPQRDGKIRYVVDFGAYGQWYCMHDELNGDDPDGWDDGRPVPEPDMGIFEAIRPQAPAPTPDGFNITFEEADDPKPSPVVDFERDLARRMKEIEKAI